MTERKVIVYGASGYTGKLVSESLAKLNIPFFAVGRNAEKINDHLKVVEERLGYKPDVEVISINHTEEDITAICKNVEVMINTVGPFMQLAEPVVKACLATNTHYLDTTGEQDWMHFAQDNYHEKFQKAGLVLSLANAYMWCAGAIAAEYVLEDPDIDMLDIVYQVDDAKPSVASTKSFLRMVCHGVEQSYLHHNEFVVWPNDQYWTVTAPHRSVPFLAHPWGGGGEPIWFAKDERVRCCSVLVGFGDEIVKGVVGAIETFNEQASHLSKAEQEEWTNNFGAQMTTTEPPKDDLDTGRTVIVVRGQGQQKVTEFSFNVSAPYQFTGAICADIAKRLLDGVKPKRTGFVSAPQAFGHRELMATYAELGYTTHLSELK